MKFGKKSCCLGKEDESWLWHKRMGHIHFDNLVNIGKKKYVREMQEITKPSNVVWKHCQHGKKTKLEFNTKEYSTKKPLEIVHTNLCGTMREKGMEGEVYFMLFLDDYTRMTWVFFLKKKSKACECFKIFKGMVGNETDLKINTLRSYNGGELTSNELWNFCEQHGIKRKLLAARTPQKIELLKGKIELYKNG